ncbi:hypothetical protein MTZ49_11785 [Entomomonas sp. E2T0]|uniref:hypothetical protein n=1 Tax=Entomomonas sp. E2T0 TaxID=2930213 RepID=UPI0022283E7E|nr:hypothetical protein [Entomomonas sp. E2T0]UYZ83271.1 hypothetical protein MTZ49_11785 [Entomomonas sp. E2T0]
MLSIQKSELIATYNYKIDGLDESLNYRLEIYKTSNAYKGLVFRLDMYNLMASFPRTEQDNPYINADVSMFIADDYFYNDEQLTRTTQEEVIAIFEEKLKLLFNTSMSLS